MTTGALTSLHFGWERYWTGTAWDGEYGTAVTCDKVFGQGQKISSLERNNNLEVIYALGQRGGVVAQEKQFAGSISIEASLANPYIFRAVLGNGGTVRGASGGGSSTVDVQNVIGARTIGILATLNFAADDWVQIQTGADTDNVEYLQIESLVTDVSLTFNSPLMYVHPIGDTIIEWDTTQVDNAYYTHVFTEMNTAPSITIQNSFDLSSDQKLLYRGCVNTGTTITCAVNEVVGLKMDFDYANETLLQTAYLPQTAETEEIYSFAHGTLKKYLGSGAWTTLAVVQNCEISINPNAEVLYGLGSRTGVERVGKQFEYDISASMMFQDVASLTELFYTGAAGSTAPGNIAPIALELDIDNGQTTTSKRACIIQLAGVKIDTNSLPQDPTAVVMEDVSMKATNMTVWGINNTSVIP